MSHVRSCSYFPVPEFNLLLVSACYSQTLITSVQHRADPSVHSNRSIQQLRFSNCLTVSHAFDHDCSRPGGLSVLGSTGASGLEEWYESHHES